MAKYIDAEKVIAALTDTLQYEGMVMDELISVVANIPAADVVERKKGTWIPFDIPWYQCSECGAVREHKSFMENFCPNCGAWMEGEE